VDERPHEQPGHFWAGWAKRVTKRQGRWGARSAAKTSPTNTKPWLWLGGPWLSLAYLWHSSRSVKSRRHCRREAACLHPPFPNNQYPGRPEDPSTSQ
jgi:hypothetical protein